MRRLDHALFEQILLEGLCYSVPLDLFYFQVVSFVLFIGQTLMNALVPLDQTVFEGFKDHLLLELLLDLLAELVENSSRIPLCVEFIHGVSTIAPEYRGHAFAVFV